MNSRWSDNRPGGFSAMRKLSLSLIAVLVLASSLFPPNAVAVPPYGVYVEYYDCNVTLVGWYYYDCSNVFMDGTQSGYYKFEQLWVCTDPNQSGYQWYTWSFSTNRWV